MSRKVGEQTEFTMKEYDANRRKFIPCFDDFYRATTDFIISGIEEPKRVIDLGAGTGLLSYFWYQRCPHAGYVLVDIADEMLNIARKRFQGICDKIMFYCAYTLCGAYTDVCRIYEYLQAAERTW